MVFMKTKRKGRLLIFSGTNKRYKFVVNKLLDRHPGASLVAQDYKKSSRAGMYDKNKKFCRAAARLMNEHLLKRDRVEARYYKEDFFHTTPVNRILRVDETTLNSDKVVKFVKSAKPTAVFVFGVRMLKDNVLKALSGAKIINLHLGLTPYYRGSETLLWPLYLQNPNHVGVTFHQIDAGVDRGPIFHQQKTVFTKKDSIHDIFCKAIVQASKPALKLVDSLLKNAILEAHSPKYSGKLFLSGEFTPNHLAVIYQFIRKGMMKKYLRGELPLRKINLYSCFKK
jgi:methionyl-tRNA formyltransferase